MCSTVFIVESVFSKRILDKNGNVYVEETTSGMEIFDYEEKARSACAKTLKYINDCYREYLDDGTCEDMAYKFQKAFGLDIKDPCYFSRSYKFVDATDDNRFLTVHIYEKEIQTYPSIVM